MCSKPGLPMSVFTMLCPHLTAVILAGKAKHLCQGIPRLLIARMGIDIHGGPTFGVPIKYCKLLGSGNLKATVMIVDLL